MDDLRNLTATAYAEVPFHDLDPMDIVWHGNHFKYFEMGRTALLERIDYDIPQMKASGYSWPVIECQCRFMRPLRYRMNIRITATLLEISHRLKISYVITEEGKSKRLSRGHTVQVAVDVARDEMCATSPEILRRKVEAAL